MKSRILLKVKTYGDEPGVAHVNLVEQMGGARESLLYGLLLLPRMEKLAKKMEELGFDVERSHILTPDSAGVGEPPAEGEPHASDTE